MGRVRNKFSGRCYYCKEEVKPGTGHPEIRNNGWAVIHVHCCLEQRRHVRQRREEKIEEVKRKGENS